MADTKLTDLAELASAYARSNQIYIVDGASKRTTLGNLLKALPGGANEVGLGITGHSLTGSNASAIVSLAATWNTTGTPTAVLLNVTDTASNAASLLMDLQVGGVSRFSVSKTGIASFRGSGTGAGNHVARFFDSAGVEKAWINGSGGIISLGTISAQAFLTSPRIVLGSEQDCDLYRDAANTLGVRRTTNAQTVRVYNTYTNASNYERLSIGWSANVMTIGTEAAGTGTLRVLHISGLPTSDPGVSGVLWNDAGTVKVSA